MGPAVEYGLWPDRVKVFHRHEGFWDVNAPGTPSGSMPIRDSVSRYIKNLFCNIEYDFRLNTQPAGAQKDG